MSVRGPSIACIGVIGKDNNPLHMSLFPPTRSGLEFSFFLSSSLDVFEARIAEKLSDQEFGLLHAIDERLATYGWATTTGIKFVIVVDMEGQEMVVDPKTPLPLGLKDSDIKPAFRALQNAYIGLLQNPFFDPSNHDVETAQPGAGSTQITSPKFLRQVHRIGSTWKLGVVSF